MDHHTLAWQSVKLTHLQAEIDALESGQTAAASRLDSTNDRLTTVEDTLGSTRKDVTSINDRQEAAEQKVSDAQRVAAAALPSAVTVMCGGGLGTGFVVEWTPPRGIASPSSPMST